MADNVVVTKLGIELMNNALEQIIKNEKEAAQVEKYNWRGHEKKAGRLEIRISEETRTKLDKLVMLERSDRTKVIENLINKAFGKQNYKVLLENLEDIPPSNFVKIRQLQQEQAGVHQKAIIMSIKK